MFAPATARISSSSLVCMAAVSRFWVFWIRKTIRNVMIVVEVLITSCQVSLNPNTGPSTAHSTTRALAPTKVEARPAKCDSALATFRNQLFCCMSPPHRRHLAAQYPPAGAPNRVAVVPERGTGPS